jgi:Fe-S oxidoreductase
MLDKGLFEDYEKCLQDEPAATTARCPVHVDVPAFCAEVAKGDFKAAYAVLQKRMPFAGAFCLVCDAPCEGACVRNALDAPVRMGALEQAAVRYGRTPLKRKFKTSKKNGRTAVVGGGISGLAAAFDLDRRGYAVTLYEQNNRLGGWLWEMLGPTLSATDIEEGLAGIADLSVEVLYHQPVDAPRLEQLLAEYDAVYLGCAKWTEPVSPHPLTLQVGSGKLFAGGMLAGSGQSVIEAVSSGKRAAVSMERFIKNISLTAEREREAAFVTGLPKSLEYVSSVAPVDAADSFYSVEEAQAEASRCLLCACDECLKACAHMQRYGRKPKTYAREIYTNENVFLGTRYANKMINSCALCGLCGERCPLKLSMAPLVAQTRRSMVAAEKMPPSAHDFALRDMAYANSESCWLVQQPPATNPVDVDAAASSDHDKTPAPFLFFPGCQLAASSPEHVESSYAWLRENLPEQVALALGCCGAPADWAGRDDLLQESLAKIRTAWEEQGRPTLILACSSCKDVFARHLPELPTLSLWEIMSNTAPNFSPSKGAKKVVNIHDACSTRHDAALQTSVRAILSSLDYQIEELRYHGEETKCCGYGGLVFYANREQEGDFALDRAKESPHDLVVYCAMCKDLFIDAGKRSFHLLDLLFADDPEEYALRRMPNLSERHANRAELKRRLSADVWGIEQAPLAEGLPGITVVIPPEVQALMDERLILRTDVEDALLRAVSDPGECFYNAEDNCYLVSIRKQYVTYWVQYTREETRIEVRGAYSHRMDIIAGQ